MTTPTDVLDAAFDRLGRWGFDDPDGYVNHGPMACEALDVLGRPAEVESWSRLESGTPPTIPVEPRRFVWTEAFGDAARARRVDGLLRAGDRRRRLGAGTRRVAAPAAPRNGRGAVPRRDPLRTRGARHRDRRHAGAPRRTGSRARVLGCPVRHGPPPDVAAVRGVDDSRLAVVHAAADAARHYRRPTQHHQPARRDRSDGRLDPDPAHRQATAATALAHIKAEHAALYAARDPVVDVAAPDVDEATLIDAAIVSGDAHAVKLVEAARRGFAVTSDPAFLAAADRVARRGLRKAAENRRTPTPH